jgi:hypothetical protein
MATTRNKPRLLLLCEVLLVMPQNSVEENTTKWESLNIYSNFVYVVGLHLGYQVLHLCALCPFSHKISFSEVRVGHYPWA